MRAQAQAWTLWGDPPPRSPPTVAPHVVDDGRDFLELLAEQMPARA
jgi:hypothetical protein